MGAAGSDLPDNDLNNSISEGNNLAYSYLSVRVDRHVRDRTRLDSLGGVRALHSHNTKYLKNITM